MLTRTNFLDREMTELRESLLLMVELNHQMLQRGSKSMEEHAMFHKDEIHRSEQDIDQINKIIQKRVLELLSYEQLALTQVKGLFLFAKIARDLERVGDHIINIIVIAPVDTVPGMVSESFSQFMKNVGKMLDALKHGILKEDRQALKWIYKKEDPEVNQLNRISFMRITESLQLDQLGADSGGRLILMSRFFERLADHVSNAAKDYRHYLKECHSSIKRPTL
ncbi:phosphate signaling complex PhoU family protein [Bacillus sp. FJAT-45037]|uniref:phosphate signaling complex PhoU family protein n=1 Tax=Bacillus sp. FJAT-45037 TaxID=2011007 RepID=UPI000C2495BD|nr:PhoU domain-containing protein [Bacillus sp. FJAT-45037]